MANNTACHEEYPKELFTATIPTLRHIHAAGKLIGIITATGRFSFEHDLNLHRIPRELLDYTQTADDTPFHKPDPRVFEPALAWLTEHNVTPESVLYVGDGLHDLKAALGAGFNFIGVETGLVTAEHFQSQNALSIISIADLIE
jgi:phosphoglycolate phosphatase-like HAD superfamily hydrolase